MDIAINGPIVPDMDGFIYDWFGIPYTSPSQVISKIEEAKKTGDHVLNIKINSGGGSVYDAAQIYSELIEFDGQINAVIQSIAASAASFLAMAADNLKMTTLAQMMVHNAANREEGNHQDMTKNAEFLKKVDESISSAYALKTGKDQKELQKMMDNTTWMTAQDALEHGFIDEILLEKGKTPTNSVGNLEEMAPISPKIVEKVRNELMKNINKQPQNSLKTPQNIENGGRKKMDLETLKNDYPDLFAQIQQNSAKEAVEAEQKRILAIDELAMPGNEELIAKAKADTSMTAADVAIQIVKNQKEMGANYLKNAKKDAEETEKVDPDTTFEKEKKKQNEEEQTENLMAAFANVSLKNGGSK